MKNLKLPLILAVTFLFYGFSGPALLAQTNYQIKGEVIDSATNKGAEYATIVILDTEGKPVTSLISESSGKFSTSVKEKGKYMLTISSIGYRSVEQPFEVTSQQTDLGKVEIIPGVEMESVTVSTTKPLIRSDIDKIAYSVEADPEAPVSTALDILRKVPLVSVDGEDNIYLQGQSNYKVLMNGKSSSLLSSNFKEMMRSMPASSIKDIEVITNPSSKYEAEGVGGIINIITNRRNDVGYNGSVGLNGNTFGGYGGYGYVNAKLGKFTVSANVYAGHFEQPDNTTIQEQIYAEPTGDGVKRIWEEGALDASGRYMNYQLESSYEIDTFNLVTLSLWAYDQKYDMDRQLTTQAWNAQDELFRSYHTGAFSRNKHGGLSGNIDYQRTFMKPDRTFTLSYKLDNNPNKSESENVTTAILNYEDEHLRSINDAYTREHTFQVDYADPITPKHFMEIGAKYILRQNDSDPENYIYNAATASWVMNDKLKRELDYDQHIVAAYAGYTFKLKKMSFKAGARLEGAWNDGTFIGYDDEVKLDNSQFDVVPYATISYAPKTTNRYSLSYTQRLARPGIWYLNPYINTTDPNSWSEGNPQLETEVAHQVNLTYGLYTPVHTLNLTGSAVITNNSIQGISIMREISDILNDPNETGSVLFRTYENTGRSQRYGLNSYYSFRKGSAFSISANVSGNYVDYSGNDGSESSGWTFRVNGNTRVGLWKNGAFTANAYYSSPNVNYQRESSGMFFYGFGLNQRFLKQKLSFNASIQSLFNKYFTYWSEIENSSVSQRIDQRQKRRSLNFSMSYNFGKMNVQVKKARRGIKNDDVKAGEGGSGSSGSTPTQ